MTSENKDYIIKLKGSFEGTGFGFSCMKRAYELQISGQLRYINNKAIDINAIGTEDHVISFFNWCLSCKEVDSAEYRNSRHLIQINNDFNIINLI